VESKWSLTGSVGECKIQCPGQNRRCSTAGEAAGYAMGLILLGTADTTSVDEKLTYMGDPT